MAIDPRIPMMGEGINTANPLQQLGAQLAEKERYDQTLAYQKEQDTYNRQRQEKMDNAALSSKALDDELTRKKLVTAEYDLLDAREQSRIRSVAIAAAQVKPFLDRGDTEGALNYAVQRQKALHARMGQGENIDDQDTAEFINLLRAGDLETAKYYVDSMITVGQMTGALEVPKQSGQQVTIDPNTGEITYSNPGKTMPPAALDQMNTALDGYGTAQNTKADIATFIQQIDSGNLKLGPIENTASNVQNYIGLSDDKSRNYSSFRSSLEKLRNDSLRLNKGVQTEGDAQRAWNELFENLNDSQLVKKRLQEISAINDRAAEIKRMEVDNIRSNYGQSPIDYNRYNQGSAIINSAPQQPGADSQDGFQQLPSGLKYKVVQ